MKATAPPEHGALEQEIALDVTVRVITRGRRDRVESDVRRRIERELPLMFSNAEIVRVKRASQ